MHGALVNTLQRLCVPPESIVDFGEKASARHLRYMDLLPGERSSVVAEPLPEGAVEVSGKAAVYVVRRELLAGPIEGQKLAQLMRTVACRADAAYLAVINAGSTTIYRVGFYAEGAMPTVESTVEMSDPNGLRGLLNDAAGGDEQDVDRLWLDDLLFKLLTRSADIDRSCVIHAISGGSRHRSKL